MIFSRMSRPLLFNLVLLFIVGFAFTYFTSDIVTLRQGHGGSAVLFALSRTAFFALASLAIVTLPLLLLRKNRKKFTVGPLTALWLLFSFINIAAYVFEQVP